jgi:hypothetical protein
MTIEYLNLAEGILLDPYLPVGEFIKRVREDHQKETVALFPGVYPDKIRGYLLKVLGDGTAELRKIDGSTQLKSQTIRMPEDQQEISIFKSHGEPKHPYLAGLLYWI